MKYLKDKLCTHYKTNGEQCEAVALTGDRFCYFHSRDRQRALVIERAHNARMQRIADGGWATELHPSNAYKREFFNESSASLLQALELPVLEDANAIQITVTNILRAIATQQIDRQSAALMLYGLQIASGVLARLRTKPFTNSAKATSDPEPLRQLVLALTEMSEKKKAVAAASANNPPDELVGTND